MINKYTAKTYIIFLIAKYNQQPLIKWNQLDTADFFFYIPYNQ